jgi:hypothetical protein
LTSIPTALSRARSSWIALATADYEKAKAPSDLSTFALRCGVRLGDVRDLGDQAWLKASEVHHGFEAIALVCQHVTNPRGANFILIAKSPIRTRKSSECVEYFARH